MRVIQTGYSHADQTLHFRVPLGGPFALWYRSARVPGFTPSLQARVPLTGAEPPDDLKKLEVSTSLDGFRREEKYKAAPHLSHTVVAPSPQDVTVRVEYRFRKGRATSERRLTLGRPDPRALGLGDCSSTACPWSTAGWSGLRTGVRRPFTRGRASFPWLGPGAPSTWSGTTR